MTAPAPETDQSGDLTDMVSRPSLEPPASDVSGWRLVPVELTDEMTEAGCRALHDAQGTGDADAPMHSPPQKSWEEPDSVRWRQWIETITSDIWPAMIAAAPPHPASKEVGDE